MKAPQEAPAIWQKSPPVARAFVYLGLSLYAILVIYPMFWLISTSLKDSWSIFVSPWALPTDPHWVNYENAMVKGALWKKFAVSAFVDVVSLVGILVVSAMAAYVLARFRFPGNGFLYYAFLAGMALPVFLGIIPLFDLMLQLGLVNRISGLILVYISYSLSFTIFVLWGFFRTLPGELAEAATIDGATPLQTFLRVMLPLAKPGLVTAGIFVFIGLWNEFPLAFVLASGEAIQTLPVGIANITMSQKYQADWGALFAALSIGVLPTVVLYSVFQRQIQSGLTAGAVKG